MNILADIFLDNRKLAVWNKAQHALLMDPKEYRLDNFGNIMRWSDYGKFNSQYGWEIDHRRASALGGSDDIGNLRALNCRANRQLGGLLGNILQSLQDKR